MAVLLVLLEYIKVIVGQIGEGIGQVSMEK